MKLYLLVGVICLGGFLNSCTQQPQPIVAAPTHRLCPRHHIALITVHGSADTTSTCILPSEDYLRLAKYYPCGIGPGESADPKAYSTPKDITYCPKCEAEEQRLLH